MIDISEAAEQAHVASNTTPHMWCVENPEDVLKFLTEFANQVIKQNETKNYLSSGSNGACIIR